MSFWLVGLIFLWHSSSLIGLLLLLHGNNRFADWTKEQVRFQPRPLPGLGLIDPWFALASFYGATLLALGQASAIQATWGAELSETDRQSLSQLAINGGLLISQLILIPIWLWYLTVRSPQLSLRQWWGVGADRPRLGQLWLLGLVVAWLCLPLLLRFHQGLSVLFDRPYDHETLKTISARQSDWIVVLSSLRAAVVSPIVEEILYRGFLLGALFHLATRPISDLRTGLWGAGEGSLPFRAWRSDAHSQPGPSSTEPNRAETDPRAVTKLPFWPVVVTALIFGFNHLGQGTAPIPLVLLALLLGELVRRTGSLWPAIAVHLALNLYSVSIMLLKTYGS